MMMLVFLQTPGLKITHLPGPCWGVSMALRRRSTTVLAGPSAAGRMYLAISSGFKEAHHLEFRKNHRVWGRQGAGIQKDAVHPVRHGLEALLKEFPNSIINNHDLIQGMIRFDDACGCSLSGASGQEQAAWAVKEAQALRAILSHMRKMAGQSKDFSRQPAWLLPLLQTLGPHLGQLEPSSPGGSSRADTSGRSSNSSRRLDRGEGMSHERKGP